jgi:hypothetical protein
VRMRPLDIQLAGVLLKRSRRELCSCGVSEPPRCGMIIVDEAIVCQSSSSQRIFLLSTPVYLLTTSTTMSRTILGQSTRNDVNTYYMNWTCPRILYFTDFGPRTERNLSFSTTVPFFLTPHMTCWRRTTGRLFP